jgi:hypothetical protein
VRGSFNQYNLRIVPLTRRFAPTSPRKRGEVSNHRLVLTAPDDIVPAQLPGEYRAMTAATIDLPHQAIADPDTQRSLGIFGAIAEFRRIRRDLHHD